MTRTGRTRIKICGVRDEVAALAAAECGADAVGFVFAPNSFRRITPDEACDIALTLPPFVAKVGLFVDAGIDMIDSTRSLCPLDYVQLHGLEDEHATQEVSPFVIKAIRFDPGTIDREIERWNHVAEIDALLIDGGAGGEGKTIDWAALAHSAPACNHPIILAGGLNPANVADAIRAVSPWAVDVSSGVESVPGKKDPRLIAAFCDAVRHADARSGLP